jgi:hypothetical protein
MIVRLSAAVMLAAVATSVAAAAAGPGTPDVSKMALRVTDVAGAKVSSQHATTAKGYEAGYERTLSLSKPFGRSLIVVVDSEVEVATATATATADFAQVQKVLRSSKDRDAFATGLAKAVGQTVTRKDITVGKLRAPHVGDAAVELPIAIKVKNVRVYHSYLVFRIERAIGILVTFGARPVVPADTARLATLVVGHIGEGFVPLPVTPPTITGTAQQGQTLSAGAGKWGNSPQLAYQWQKCDAAGAACADVAGATAQTYTVTPTDAGATLRVMEKATNRFGTATAQSAQTTVVT